MRSKQLYVADDGAEFTSEEECLDHEAAVIASDLRLKSVGAIYRAFQDPTFPTGTQDYVKGFKDALKWAVGKAKIGGR